MKKKGFNNMKNFDKNIKNYMIGKNQKTEPGWIMKLLRHQYGVALI